MTSSRKKDANKKNAANSTGPKTEAGKRSMSLNALMHGFYSRELTVSEPDKRDFEILRESLLVQLAPRSALQHIGFEQIVTCCWRCKLAIRLEMHRLKVHFTANDESVSTETAPQRDVRETQWYGASRQDLKNGIRILQTLGDDVSQNGLLHAENWKDEIVKAFGVAFYDSLTEWKPMNVDAMYMAEHLQRHAETFKRPLPASERSPEGVEVIADPKQKLQMLVKLIDLKAQHLQDLQQISSEASYTRDTAPSEFAPRYFASASRDLQRAVDWYLYLRSKDL
jgi:hypothetical protein